MTNFEKYKKQLLSFDYVEGNTPAKKEWQTHEMC